MIQLKDVCKSYQVGDDRVRALDHANLHIYPQEFVSIIGPSCLAFILMHRQKHLR